MPLPIGDIAWPPAQLAPALDKMAEWSAWFSNDPGLLGNLYGAKTTQAVTRPSQYRGGVQGTLARWFWGTPAVPGQQRAKVHLPIASDICTASSDLLFAETVKVTVPDDIGKAQAVAYGDRLELLLDGIAWDSLLPEQGELNAALGGVYLRAVWDKEVEPDHPLVTAVHADAAWPEFAYGRLKAVTFWETVHDSGAVRVRLLERHELVPGTPPVGRIEYGVYVGTVDKLGRRVPYEELAQYGIAAPEVDPDGDGVSVSTGIPYLSAVYVPNMKPNRLWRSHPVCSNLGRSDFDGVEPLLDAADETMTSWMRDIRLGKGRIIVPEWMLRNGSLRDASTGVRTNGGGSIFNIDQEVFTGLTAPPMDGGDTKSQLTVQQFAIRTAEHADTLAGILAATFRGAGYSQQTFGLADEAAATATEVSSRDRRSDTTREKKSRYYSPALGRFLRAFVALDGAMFDGPGGNYLPDVTFPPASRPDPEVQARSVQALRAAQVLSIYTGVKMTQPDLDDDGVKLEVQRIFDDLERSQPTLTDLGALPGEEGGGPADPEAPQPGQVPPALAR